MRLGIDVGGTNTNAVLVADDGKIVAVSQQLTTDDILTGIFEALKQMFSDTKLNPKKIKGVFIGTTHVSNALYFETGLVNVALIRLSKQKSFIKPALKWPKSLKSYIRHEFHVPSTLSFTKKDPTCVIENEVLSDIFSEIEKSGVEAVCIVGANSPFHEIEEKCVQKQLLERFPDMHVTMSHTIGSLGFIERENAALLNAMLSKVLKNALKGISTIFEKLNVHCPYWLIQNNGSIMSIEEAMHFPILTISSGVLNSLRGASILTELRDFILVDVGGSTINIGKMVNGRMEENVGSSTLLGIEINMPIPAITSLPFGFESVVKGEKGFLSLEKKKEKLIGNAQITLDGNKWTITDCFLKKSPIFPFYPNNHKRNLEKLSEEECQKIVKFVIKETKQAIDKYEELNRDIPIVLVGGASPFLKDRLFGKYRKVYHPAGYAYCNAIGACYAPVSAQLDKVLWLHDEKKEHVIEKRKQEVIDTVIRKGAKRDTVQVVSIKEYPFAYLKGQVLRVRIKAEGEL
ncbi:hydantoinase/oxoprolinase N-terminal domain-containing protein [Bacillus alveayuensis]|uniref:N-methylhydantoinase A/oxoprolinase/acetone carboxylase beta subunit n=1 Tax=Aeribacillus alveayuensis TaxID=279215 RepID=A0ABT9VPI5_9BACI|nr:hydantoinase/oxoprolinase N-terminal domain-containing protein [Bacillus alveayuensis]MDQ0162858.1 N-methylhydantoinase A/oxoprolinase/acetone carboxylase beta subunit [Bacillus alveayuensis]